MLNKKSLAIVLLLIGILAVSIGSVSATDAGITEIDDQTLIIEQTTIDSTNLTDNLGSDAVSNDGTSYQLDNVGLTEDTSDKNTNNHQLTEKSLNTASDNPSYAIKLGAIDNAPLYATITATGGSFTDLQNILDGANNGDTILLSGNYKYDPSTDEPIYDQGGITITKDVTIDGQGTYTLDGSFDFTTYDGGSDYTYGSRILYSDSPVSITLKNINFINGLSNPNYGDSNGGAVYFEGSTQVSIINCNFNKNYALDGSAGAICVVGTTATIENSDFTENSVLPNSQGASTITGMGAVITVKDSTFKDNYIPLTSAIYNNLGVPEYNGVIESLASPSIMNAYLNISGTTFENTNMPDVSILLANPDSYAYTSGFIYSESPIEISDSSFNNGLGLGFDASGALNLVDNSNNRNGNIYGTLPVTITNTNFTNIKSIKDSQNIGGDNGAIYTQYDTIIDGCNFENIEAQGSAGAINSYSGTLTVSNSNFKNTKATDGDGGAIYFASRHYNSDADALLLTPNSKITVTNSNFDGVTASGNGGAIYTQANITISNSNFNNYHADNGGAIYSKAGTINITNSNLTNGKATTDGGAIYFSSYYIDEETQDFITTDATLSFFVNQSVFQSNDAGRYGGLVCSLGTDLTITHSVIYNNSVNYDTTALGAAIIAPAGPTTDANCNDNWFGTNDPQPNLYTLTGATWSSFTGIPMGSQDYWKRYYVLNFTTSDNSTVFNGSTNTLIVSLDTVYDAATNSYTEDLEGVPKRTVVFTSNVSGTFNPVTEDLLLNSSTTFNPSVSGVNGVLYATVDGVSVEIEVLNSTATNTTNGTDILVSVIATPTSVNIGNAITFQVSVSNIGDADVGNVTVKLSLPSSGIYTKTAGTYDPVDGTWFIGDLGISQTQILTTTITFNTTGIITNTFNVTCNETETNLTNNYAEVNVTINPAVDLIISANINNTNPIIDTFVEYTIKLYNAGPSTSENTNVTLTIPSNFEYLSSTASAGTSYSNATKVWTIGNLNNGNNVTLVVRGKVTAVSNLAFSAVATTNVTDTNLSSNTVSLNNVVSNITYANTSDLGITLVRTTLVGNALTYRVTVTNVGPDPANNVTVTYNLPTGLNLTNSNLAYTNTGNKYTWNLGTLNAGASRQFIVFLSILDNGQYLNTFQVLGNEVDSYPLNNTAEDVLIYGQDLNYSDIGVEIIADNYNPEINDQVTFTILVTNVGPNNATNITVTSVLPAGLTFVSSPDSNYNPTTGTWTINNLAVDGLDVLTLIVNVSSYGLLEETVNVQALEIDNVSINNTASLAFYVERNTTSEVLVDLITIVTPSSSTAAVNDTVTYIITVINAGPENATAVTLKNELLNDISVVSTNGTYNVGTGVWTIGTLYAGNTASIEFIVKPTKEGSFVTNFTVNSYETDKDPTSNSANALLVVTENATFGRFIIANVTNTINSNVSVPIVILDSTGKTINNGTVTVNLNGNTYSANVSNGVATVPITLPSTTGLYPATVTYTGDTGTHMTSFTANATSLSTQGVNIRADSVTGLVNENVTVNVTVTDNTGAYRNNGTISIVIEGNNYTANVTSGLAKVNITLPSTTGVNIETVEYISDDLTGIGNVILNVNPVAVNITAWESITTGVAGQTVNTLFNVTDIYGNNVTDGTVTVTVNGTSFIVPVNNGIANVSVNLPINPNLYDATAVYQNGAIISNTSIKLNATTPEVGRIIVNNISGVIDSNSTLQVVVFDTNNNPVSNGTVSLSVNGNTYSANVTDGVANIPLTIPSSVGTYPSTLTYNGVSTNSTTITVTAVSGANSTNNTNTTDVNLGIKVEVSNANPVTDEVFTYLITVTNNGPADATNVTITDVLPVGLTFVSATSGYSDTTGTCVIERLGKGLTTYMLLSVKSANSGTFTNSVKVECDQNETYLPNTTDSITVTIRKANVTNTTTVNITDLAITIASNNSNPMVGEEFTLTLNVTNNGPSNATNVVITGALPAGLDLVVAIALPITVPTLAVGDSVAYDILVKPTALGLYTTVVSVSADELDDIPSNNVANTLTIVNVTNTTGEADIIVNVTRDKENVSFGDTVTYIVTITNAGPNDATNVIVNGTLPENFEFLFATGGYDNNTGIWNISSIDAGMFATRTVTGIAKGYGLFEFNVTAIADEDDPDPTTNSNHNTFEVLNVTQYVDMGITVTVTNENPYINETFIYIITVTNNGPSNATNVTITDILPVGLTLVSATPGYDTTSGEWVIESLSNGSSISLILSAKGENTGTFTNNVKVTCDQVETYTTNTTDSVAILINDSMPTNVEFAELGITLTQLSKTNNTVMYIIRVRNNGPNLAENVVVKYVPPTGINLISSNRAYNPTTNTWTFGNISANGENSIIFTVNVTAEGVFNNIVTVTSSQVDSYPLNNTASLILTNNHTFYYADLGIQIVVDNATPEVGDIIKYTIIVTNNGPDDANNITITAIIPPELVVVSSNSSDFNVTSGTWTINNLAAYVDNTLSLEVNVTDYGTYEVSVSVESAEIDNITNNNRDVSTIMIIKNESSADLAITIAANDSTVILGQTVTYTITVTNNGPNNATNIIIQNELPTELTLINTNTTYDNNTNTWNISTLENGNTLIIEFTVNTTSIGNFVNNVTVTGLELDSIPTNNVANTLINVIENVTFGKFILANITNVINANITVPIVVLDSNGNILNNGNITVHLNGSDYTAPVIDGVANVPITVPSDVGLYTADVTYEGNTGINTTTFTVNATNVGSEPAVIINIDPINGTIREAKTVNVTVKDTEGNNLPNGIVTITINNQTYTGIVTNGVTNIPIVLPNTSGVTIGKVNYTNGTLNGTTNVPVIANPAPAIITPWQPVTSGTVDQTVNILFNVRDTFGNNMTEGVVTLLLDGTGYSTTVNNGIANVTLTLPNYVGEHNTTVTYTNGDLTSNTTIIVNITNVPVKEIVVSNVTKTINSIETVPVVVLDTNNNTVKEGIITIIVNGVTSSATIENGVAKVPITVPGTVGEYVSPVSYTGPNGNIVTTMLVNATPADVTNGAIITVSPINGSVNDNVQVNFTVTDIYGNNLPNGTVILTVGGTNYPALVNNGKAITIVTLPNTVGTFIEPVKYIGEEVNGTGLAVVTVNPIPVILTPRENVTSGKAGETTNIIFDVKDTLGNDVTEGTVTLNVEGITYSTQVTNGIANITTQLPANAGEYNVTANYYNGEIVADANITLNVSSTPVGRIIAGNVTDFIGTNVNVPVVIVDTEGQLINGGTVIISVDGTSYSATVTEGVANVPIAIPSTEGKYNATVTYIGDSGTTNTRITVTALDYLPELKVEIGVNPIIGNMSQNVTVPINVTYNDGSKVTNGTITLTIDGTDYTVNVTNGTANVPITLPNTAGTYPVDVKYTDGINDTTKTTNAIVLDPTIITILMTATDVTGEVDSTQDINITIIRSDGEPITTGTITLTLDGTDYTVPVTSENVIIPVTLPSTSGNYTTTITYVDGNLTGNTTSNVEATKNETPTNATAIININPITGNPGENVMVPVLIIDAEGNLLNNGTVTINIAGTPYIADVTGGVAYVTVTIPETSTIATVDYTNGEVSNTTLTPVLPINPEPVVDHYADVGVKVTVDKNRPTVGEYVTYTITVFNNGPDTAHNVTIKEVLPTSLTVISATENYTIGWIIDELNANESKDLTLVCEVLNSGAISTITSVNASEIDTNTSNNKAIQSIIAQNTPTPITLDTILVLYNLTETYGDGEYEVGTLTDVNGNPLAGQHIAMNLTRLSNGESKIYWATTDYQGHVRLQINLAPGNYTSKAYFEGNTISNITYNPSESQTARIIVNAKERIPTIISLNNYTGVYHHSDYMTGNLTDIYGNVLGNQVVGLNMTRLRTGESKVYWVLTQTDGSFSRIIDLRNDDYTCTGVYAGNDVYMPSQSSLATMKVVL